MTKINEYITCPDSDFFKQISEIKPWDVILNIEAILKDYIAHLSDDDYLICDHQAIHRSAIIEEFAQLKGPLVIEKNVFIGNGSLIRGGAFIGEDCIVGHCGELKSSIMFNKSKIAHLNFVGDSILGVGANVEAGAMIANYRNEREEKQIFVRYNNKLIGTGVEKFGSILGDGTKVGANAVLAPGCLIEKNTIIQRGEVVDHDMS